MEENKSIIDYDKLAEEREAREKKEAEAWHEYHEKLERESNKLGKQLIESYQRNRQAEEEKDAARLNAAIEQAKAEAEERVRREWQNENGRSEYAQTEHEKQINDALRQLVKGL